MGERRHCPRRRNDSHGSDRRFPRDGTLDPCPVRAAPGHLRHQGIRPGSRLAGLSGWSRFPRLRGLALVPASTTPLAAAAIWHDFATSKRLVSGGVATLLVACALAGCSKANSGIFGGPVVGVVVSADGTCVNGGPTFFNEFKERPTCFATRVGRQGSCVKVSADDGPGTIRRGSDVGDHVDGVVGEAKHQCLAEPTLQAPYGLAVGPDGTLYVVDAGRDQVLKLANTGYDFSVVAGNGQQGFAGDGGPATQAKLHLTQSSSLAVGADGTLYIADTGNDRVRAVTPGRTISTVLGNGQPATSLATGLATGVGVGPVSGLTIGPGGGLYAAVSLGVVELTAGGTLRWVVGSANPADVPLCGVYCNPAGEADFADPQGLTFDVAGDLFVSGGGASNGVYERASGGGLSYLGIFRGDGAPAALAEAPGGSVVMSYRGGIDRLGGSGATTPITSLAGVLGTQAHVHANVFIGGDGLAVGPDGSIYVDTNTGNTFTSVSALVQVSATGASPKIIWES